MVAIPVFGTPIKVEPSQILTKPTGHTGSPMVFQYRFNKLENF